MEASAGCSWSLIVHMYMKCKVEKRIAFIVFSHNQIYETNTLACFGTKDSNELVSGPKSFITPSIPMLPNYMQYIFCLSLCDLLETIVAICSLSLHVVKS